MGLGRSRASKCDPFLLSSPVINFNSRDLKEVPRLGGQRSRKIGSKRSKAGLGRERVRARTDRLDRESAWRESREDRRERDKRELEKDQRER